MFEASAEQRPTSGHEGVLFEQLPLIVQSTIFMRPVPESTWPPIAKGVEPLLKSTGPGTINEPE
jgi:hypothetical protein